VRTDTHCDVAVIGGGALGLATAHVLLEQRPELHVVVVERRAGLRQRAGRNECDVAGNLLTAVGPRPHLGRAELLDFLERSDVPTSPTAHLVVAADAEQRVRLRHLYDQARLDLDAWWLEADELEAIEPTVTGTAAVRVTGTLLADARTVSEALSASVLPRADVQFGTAVEGISFRRGKAFVETSNGMVVCDQVLNCAGSNAHAILHATAGCPTVDIDAMHEDIAERRSLGPETLRPNHLVATLPVSRVSAESASLLARPDGSLSMRSRRVVPAPATGLRRLASLRHPPLHADTLLRPIVPGLRSVDTREVSRDRRVRTVLHGVWDSGPSIYRHQLSTHVLDLGERSLGAAFRAAVQAVSPLTVGERLAG
jgi:hypothetical protein